MSTGVKAARVIQRTVGLALLLLAVSTNFEFPRANVIEVHIFEHFTAQLWVSALAILGMKAGVAFAGSYLLIRKTLILPPTHAD